MKSNNFAFYVVPTLNKTFPRKIEKLIYAQEGYRDLCSVYIEVSFMIWA